VFILGFETYEKFKVKCPECGEMNDVLWFPRKFIQIRSKGTTGGSGNKIHTDRSEKVQGTCSCGYKFKLEDI
jgi:hypothetical protein